MKVLRVVLLWIGWFLLTGCGSSGGDAPPVPPPPPATASLTVTAHDAAGRFVAGASVTSPTGSAVTDASGRATVAVAAGTEQVVTVTKAGFAEQVKALTVPAGRAGAALPVMLIAREAPIDIAAIESGGSATGRDGVKVTFPASALVDGAGRAVTGTIQMQMTPVDVTRIDIGAFPGVFEGLPTGAGRDVIASYGTAELLPLQGGNKLQLAPGKSATIELPIYAAVHQDGSPVVAGETIALWSLDTAAGVWKQEGSGTVVASAAAPSGLALRAGIAHFSWWNADVRTLNATVTVAVSSPARTIPDGTLVGLTGQIVTGSGPAWTASTSLPFGSTTTVRLPSNATTRLAAHIDLSAQTACDGSANVAPAPNASLSVTIVVACIDVPVPTIVRPAATVATNSARPLAIDVTIDGSTPDSVEVLVDGAPIQTFPPQFFYRAFWDSASFFEGTHVVTARTHLGTATRTSQPVTVVVDRTAPQATATTPPAATAVDGSTEFTVAFDEPVTPAPFALGDVVKLSVVPSGQSVPVEIAATLSYDNVQQLVRVRPAAALPFGTASVSWGGLRDAAGNAVAGQVAATWRVSQTTALGATGGFTSRLSAARDAGGVVHTAGVRQSDGALIAMRGPTFVQIGPAINDRTIANSDPSAIAVDASGRPVVAFVQVAANGTDREVVVRRYDAATDRWLQLGAAFGDAHFGTQVALAIDGAGRLVLGYLSGAQNLGLRVFRFDGTNWADLGTLSDNVGQFALRLDAAGNPVVAIERQFLSLFVQRYNGTTWLPVGSTIDAVAPGNGLAEPVLALDAAGQPWVAWGRSTDAAVHLVRFDGTAFVDVPVTPGLMRGALGLAIHNGDPVVASDDSAGNFYGLARLHNGTWEDPVPLAGRGDGALLFPSGNALTAVVRTGGGASILQVVFP